MKKMVLGAILLAGLPILAKEKEKQSISFINKDEEKAVRLFIKKKDDGTLVDEKQLRPNESYDFSFEEGSKFAIQAHQEGDQKLDTGLNYLYLRSKHKNAEVEIIKTVPLFSTTESLVFSSNNAAIRTPWFAPHWQKEEK